MTTRFLFILISALLIASPALAQTRVTVDLDAPEARGCDYAAARSVEGKTVDTGETDQDGNPITEPMPAPTGNAYCAGVLKRAAADYERQRVALEADNVRTTYESDETKREAIRDAAGTESR